MTRPSACAPCGPRSPARSSLRQPQYQAAELLIGVITHGYRVAEVPATIHKRQVGESKKGHNAFYALHFASVIAGTWLARASAPRPQGLARPDHRAVQA